MTGPRRARTSSTLLSVLACSEPRGATKTQGVSRVDQGDRAVLHLGGRVALGVDVADLLELQRPFERDREVEVAAEVEGAPGRGDPLGGLDRSARSCRTSPISVGDRLDRIDDGQAVGEREVPEPAQVERQQGQDGDLGRERLGAGDADLGAGVQVDAAVGLAGDRAADGVDDRQGRMPPPLRLAEGAQRVGRLARLAEDEDERPVVERGVAVAELAGVLDLDRQVGQPLDQVLADQGRVPARAAGGEDDPADPAELRGP